VNPRTIDQAKVHNSTVLPTDNLASVSGFAKVFPPLRDMLQLPA
jgi:hypothetical protein